MLPLIFPVVMGEALTITIAAGSVSRQVYVYPGMPVEELRAIVSCLFPCSGGQSAVGLLNSDGAVLPLSLVCW